MVKYKIKTKECQLIVKAKLSSSEKIDERELYFFTRKYIRGLLKPQMEKNLVLHLLNIQDLLGSVYLSDCKSQLQSMIFYLL